MKRQMVISLIGFVVIIGIGVVAFRTMANRKVKEPSTQSFEATKYVKVLEVGYKDNQFTMEANGRLNSKNSIEIFSEVQGVMKPETASFKVGNSFKKGTILISIDDEENKLQIMSQKSEYLNLLAMAMPDIKVDFPQSFPKWNAFVEKLDINKPLPELPEYESNKEKFFLASRKILTQYYAIKNLEVRSSKYVIRAPFDGTVTQSMIEAGTLVRTGQKLGEFAGVGTYELEISLNPADADFISIGNSVRVKTSNGVINGSVIRKSSNIDANTQTIKIYVGISGSELSDGMYLQAELIGKKIPNSMLVPRKSVINNSFVYVNNDDKLDKMKVEIIALGSEYAYINGLAEGTLIISEPIVNPTLGMKIETIK